MESNRTFAWILAVVGIIVATVASTCASGVLGHGERLAVVETQIDGQTEKLKDLKHGQRTLDKKLDRVLIKLR